MKTRLLIMFGMISGFVFFPVSVFASCGAPYSESFHWPSAPCLDSGESNEEEKNAFATYYYYKGSDWIEQKTYEFENLMKDGFSEELLHSWIGDDETYVPENYYFWQYYQLFGNLAPTTPQGNVDIPTPNERTCDEDCKNNIESHVNPYVCKNSGDNFENYMCAQESRIHPTILLTSTDETGKQMTFRPSEITVSLGINNTIRWHNTSYVTTISNQDGVYDSQRIPFNDIEFQVLDKIGKYEFYDESNPSVKMNVNVVPLDQNFNVGNPITRFTIFPDVQFQIFRENSDSQNFFHSVSIIDSNSVSVNIDNTMDSQYAVNKNQEMILPVTMSIGDTIVSGCTYHHNTYSRIFYQTLYDINTDNHTAEFKETLDYVPENMCEKFSFDPEFTLSTLKNTAEKNTKVNYVDFRDMPEELIEVECSMGLGSSASHPFSGGLFNFLKCNSSITLAMALILIGIVVGIIFIIRAKRK